MYDTKTDGCVFVNFCFDIKKQFYVDNGYFVAYKSSLIPNPGPYGSLLRVVYFPGEYCKKFSGHSFACRQQCELWAE
jgi:hypothetical protein